MTEVVADFPSLVAVMIADPGATPRAIKLARSKCLDLIDRLDLRRKALREALAEIRLFYKVLSEKLPETGATTALDRDDNSESA